MAYDLFTRRHTQTDWSLGSNEPNVWTRSALKGEFLRVLELLDLVNGDMSLAVKSGHLSPSEWENWHRIYLNSHEFLTNASPYWGSNAEIAREHEAQALKWRDLVVSRGAPVQGPKNPGRENESPFNPINIALGIGGIAATALLITAVRK
jgi:hypothetical protein